MGGHDPLETQRDTTPRITTELAEAGYVDARVIGEGGFGIVYRCTETDLDRTVAVKVLTSDLDDDNRARFVREQRAMGRLTGHPNIVPVLRVGTTESERPYLVMPYHEQGSLQDRIHRHGPLTTEETLRLGVKIAGAIESAHRLGILHLDVKPANILLTDYGEPALTDFGIARVASGFMTATGTIVGSPAFTAPEVLAGERPGRASDVYGMGATLFCALTGHAAFQRRSGEQVVAQFLRISRSSPPDLAEEGIDDDLSGLIGRAMARDPSDRPSVTDLADELRRIQSHRGLPTDEMALRTASLLDQPASPVPLTTGRSPAARPEPRHVAPTGRIPQELSSFVGRRAELSEARTALSTSRLVTLSGVGGVGKTRLAIRTATAARTDFPDGIWMIELADLHSDALVADLVADTLGLSRQGGMPATDCLVDYLSSRKSLLVLDNCEHIVLAVAELTAALLRSSPDLRVLATSREALGVSGEAVLVVPPLAVPGPDSAPPPEGAAGFDAIALFVERAAAALPGFALTADNAADVTGICRRLDGLPLPIELAAARLRVMSPHQILERLRDRYALLTQGNRSAPSRQQTLRWCIDWSYDLCTADEQAMWARTSVFAGSADLDAAEYVCGSPLGADPGQQAPGHPDDLLDLLTALVDKSVVIREEAGGSVRFRMLETVREYGNDKLDASGDTTELRRRHRDWYLRLALEAEAAWIGPTQPEWITRLDLEQPNLREALAWCLDDDGPRSGAALEFVSALQPFWFAHGRITESTLWLDRALSRAAGPETDRALLAKALYRGCSMNDVVSATEAGDLYADEARRLAVDTTDVLTLARLRFAEGLHAMFRGELASAREFFGEALSGFHTAGDVYERVVALLSLGWANELSGDDRGALQCHEEVLAICEQYDESSYRSHALWGSALARWHLGERDRALGLLAECLQLARSRRDPLLAASGIETLAWIVSAEGSAERAAILMGTAQRLSRDVGSAPGLFPTLAAHHDDCIHVTRTALGADAFATATRRGEALDLDTGVDYALGEQPGAGPRKQHTATRSRTGTDLTTREREVAALVAEGLTNKAIAQRLVISIRTAQGHVEHILTKLGFTNRAQIAAWVVAQHHA
ncbi:protein kinase [Rhodococcus sp. NPDC003318]|uniref:protein kinase domain-containing protein n=1 Tax=Rhodococcus sp. NPDC003318 TaxID=3364503 RepID=UPI0036CE74A2